ncbi:hypothetical protein FQ775_22555 [Nitratireductor mangrovi]|uniref:Uncharacterized protein n=1 Tax=Nitratireductor mangrovi TaxID=2599600 RepID=A0A5B8L5B3_9HYPH|nr:hypothetical protein [Nitratireductor mangrovi]QDZ02923.1 hypothetical protein FQ775_22555 [Nitratireductor mangrovi]
MTETRPANPATASLLVLIILQLVMLAALFARTPPHPPLAVAPFAMAPFLAAAIAVAAAAMMLGAERTRGGAALSALAALAALVSYGPHKWFDAAIPEIWPAVLTAEVAVGVIAWRLVRLSPLAANAHPAGHSSR